MLCFQKIQDNLEILTEKELEDFLTINFSKHFKLISD